MHQMDQFLWFFNLKKSVSLTSTLQVMIISLTCEDAIYFNQTLKRFVVHDQINVDFGNCFRNTQDQLKTQDQIWAKLFDKVGRFVDCPRFFKYDILYIGFETYKKLKKRLRV